MQIFHEFHCSTSLSGGIQVDSLVPARHARAVGALVKSSGQEFASSVHAAGKKDHTCFGC